MSTPSMAEVLAKHESSRPAFIREADGVEWHRGVSVCACGETFTGTLRDHVAQALADAGFGHVASVERERDNARRVTERALEVVGTLEAQVADLQRWKDEALPVMSGLQELGRALDLPLGERITGERALEAVQALVAQVAAVRTLYADARRSAGGPFVAKVDVLSIERALDVEGTTELTRNSGSTPAESDAQGWVDRHGDVWRLGVDGLMHTPETQPFPREHVEKKWGPLRPVAEITTPAEPDADEREALAEIVLRVHEPGFANVKGSRLRDTLLDQFREVADAILANDYSRTPDAHLAAAKAEGAAEALEEAAADLAKLDAIGQTRRDLISDADWDWFVAHALREIAPHGTGDVARAAGRWLRARAARLREQGGGEGDE